MHEACTSHESNKLFRVISSLNIPRLILSVYMMARIEFCYCLTQNLFVFISDLDHAVSEDVAGNFCLLQEFCISSRIVQSGAELP